MAVLNSRFAHVGQRLPDFLIIGAQKAGTRWLLNHLRRHPQLGLPEEEVHFFDKPVNFNKGLQWYAEQFSKVNEAVHVGEKTPDYLWVRERFHPEHLAQIPTLIKKELPNVKLICVLRNPVERAISAANHLLRQHYIKSKDLNGIFENSELLFEHGMLDMGKYVEHLQAYYNLFQNEQIKIMVYERNTPFTASSWLNEVLDFLGVERVDESFINHQRVNVSKVNIGIKRQIKMGNIKLYDQRTKWRPGTRVIQQLIDYYEPHNHKLFEFLGYEIEEWSN